MELVWLDDFLALEQTRNFTRGAALRHTTQSAYSRRILRLEEWLGCKLFERDTRPLRLTPQGQEFLTRARLLRTDIMDTRRALQVLGSNYAQSLRIYTTNTLAVGFLPGFLQQLDSKPTSVLVASVTGCLDALTTGRCDCILVPSFTGDVWPEVFVSKVVGHDHLMLMATPKTASEITIKRHKLYGPIMMYTPGVRYGQMVNDLLMRYHLSLDQPPVCESASAEALVAQVRNHMGAAFIPAMLASPECVICPSGEKFSLAYDIVLLSRQKIF